MEDLIKRVREIDSRGADYLESEDKDVKSINFVNGSAMLMSIMIWAGTPQGHVYWMQIAKELGEEF